MSEEWEVETIPQTARLYMRVHRMYWTSPDPDYIPASCFKDIPEGEGMSTDWEEYSSASESRQRAKMPVDNAIVSLLVGEVDEITDQHVRHDPLPLNRAHTLVHGPKPEKIRRQYSRIAKKVISINDPLE